MGTPLDDLVDLLQLEPLEVNLFRGYSPKRRTERIFGGQVLAQSLMAAARTVDEDRTVHSLHAYFLRPGDPKVPIIFDVDRIRDGRSFTTRRVVAIQHGEAIFNASAQFHVTEDGPAHSDPMPDVPMPDELEPLERLWHTDDDDGPNGPWDGDSPLDVRFVGGNPWRGGAARSPVQDLWVRTRGELSDNPVVHATLATFVSDIALLGTAAIPHRDVEERLFQMASLDHVMWFHRPFRVDEWLLFHQHSPAAGGARGFAHGSVFRADGSLVLSIAQEGLMRPLR